MDQDVQREIEAISSEVEKLPGSLEWRSSVLGQLEYCLSVVRDQADPARLEQFNMGLIAVRELEPAGLDALADRIQNLQFQLQTARLPYAAKVRLGIGRR